MATAKVGPGPRIRTAVMLAFAELTGVRATIESYPLERAADAYARMMSGKAEFPWS
jgi:D-arabinose 1-dehydrogenase-like Zn-dependent alcohol dehydrogenase